MAGARKQPNEGSGKYQGYFIDWQGRRKFFIGTTSRKETIKLAQHLESEHRQMALGTKAPPTAPAKHRKRPFLEVVQEHIDWGKMFGRRDGKPWTADTADRKADTLKKWAEMLGLETLADLNDILPRVEAVLKELTDAGFTRNGLSTRVTPLISFCNWCVGHGYLTANPLEKLTKIDKTPETERRALVNDEIVRLFSVAPGWRRLAYAVAICTGLRLSELRRLDRGDLDTENSRLHLRWKQTKNKKPAYCYVPVKLVTAIAEFADSGSLGRLYRKAHIRRALPETPLLYIPTHLLRLFNEDLEKVGIPKQTRDGRLDVHALRATSITLAAEEGANVKELMALARHSDPKLTMGVYAKKRDPRMVELAERIGGLLPAESATTVHFDTEAFKQGTRKMLQEQHLSLTECERGLDPEGFRPLFITLQ